MLFNNRILLVFLFKAQLNNKEIYSFSISERGLECIAGLTCFVEVVFILYERESSRNAFDRMICQSPQIVCTHIKKGEEKEKNLKK